MKECKRKPTISNIAQPCDCEMFDKATKQWVCDESYGKCRFMANYQGKKLKENKQ
jgi:hypothetical protein